MDVRPGYKQTEVGVIPEQWEVCRLDEVVDFFDGRRRPVKESDRAKMRGDIPYYGASGIVGYVNDYIFDDELILLGEDGENILSRNCRLAFRVLGKVWVNNHAHVLKPKGGNDIGYLTEFLESLDYGQYNTGTAQPKLNKQVCSAIPVATPRPAEQRAIAAALSDVDALLAKLDHLIAKKLDLKQAAMQQLLTGRTRLPGFSGEWEMVRFSDVADKTVPWSLVGGPFGSNLKASDYVEEGVRIIQLQNIGEGRFHDDYAIYTSEAKADELLSNNIYPGEIILSKMGDPVGRACFVPEAGRRYLMASDGIRLAVYRRRFNKRFVHDFINSPYFRKHAIEASTGSTRQRIGISDLKALPFVAPPLSEQTAIATVLSDMDAEIAALEARRDKTRALKQGMMQELLTGRIRLVQPETNPEVAMPAHDQLRKAANDGRNWAFNEAVIISVLAENFADASYPLGRMRYTKLSYLLHRYANEDTDGYLKKAAGPYNPATRYKGPERIAQTSGYVKAAKAGNLHGFVAGEQPYKARTYFDKWYGPTALEWLRQFRYEKNEALELLTTVDKVVEELRSAGREVTVQSVKEVLLGEPEWKPKLERPVFSDEHIQAAILRCQRLFGAG